MKDLSCRTVVILLSGGRGERLLPLTEHRAKPAVPFGGKYRIIDFVLSNCVNSGLNRIKVMPQYKYASLVEHLNHGWIHNFNRNRGESLEVLPPQMRVTDSLEPYQGTADAVFQNIYSLWKEKPEQVLILPSDQIYRMDYGDMIDFHQRFQADLTIAAVETNREVAKRSGVLEIDGDRRIVSFEEKPENPKPLPDNPDRFLVSTSIYVFNPRAMIEELKLDAQDADSMHDFSMNIIPKMMRGGRKIFVLPLRDPQTGQPVYWRDVGTIESYFETNLNLVSPEPWLNLYDQDWRWWTFQPLLPPAKIVFRAEIEGSIIGEGCIIDDSRICNSVLSSRARVGKGVEIVDSIIMEDVEIQDGAKIFRAIVDKENVITQGAVVAAGKMKYCGKFEVTSSDIVVLPRHWED